MTSQRLDIISFLRGFAIFTIVLMHLLMRFHFDGTLGKAIMFGGAGVHVFLLCSGFGLYLSHLNKPLNYLNFVKKRFFKIYGPYVAATLLWFIWFTYTTQKVPFVELSSHIFLWKMFSVKYDTSLCYAYWFISSIIQFYLCWPLIVKLMKSRFGLWVAIAISLGWSSLVGVLGYEELRPWGSFFLQYLWEFCLGMYLAKKYRATQFSKDSSCLNWICVETWPWWLFFVGILGGMGLTGAMAFRGGILKLYNDIPSLIGYLFCALLIFRVGIPYVKKFFIFLNTFSYELYLIHAFVYAIIFYCVGNALPTYLSFPLALSCAIFVSWLYQLTIRKFIAFFSRK